MRKKEKNAKYVEGKGRYGDICGNVNKWEIREEINEWIDKLREKKDTEKEIEKIIKGKINIMTCQYARMYEKDRMGKRKKEREALMIRIR